MLPRIPLRKKYGQQNVCSPALWFCVSVILTPQFLIASASPQCLKSKVYFLYGFSTLFLRKLLFFYSKYTLAVCKILQVTHTWNYITCLFSIFFSKNINSVISGYLGLFSSESQVLCKEYSNWWAFNNVK